MHLESYLIVSFPLWGCSWLLWWWGWGVELVVLHLSQGGDDFYLCGILELVVIAEVTKVSRGLLVEAAFELRNLHGLVLFLMDLEEALFTSKASGQVEVLTCDRGKGNPYQSQGALVVKEGGEGGHTHRVC